MDDMKTLVMIKQKNLKENIEQILCNQVCDVTFNENECIFNYKENKPYNGTTTISAKENECTIKRIAENSTTLHLIENKKTKGIVESIYGTFNIDVHTNKYFKKEELIALEYDILNQNEILDSYRLMIKFKKLV